MNLNCSPNRLQCIHSWYSWKGAYFSLCYGWVVSEGHVVLQPLVSGCISLNEATGCYILQAVPLEKVFCEEQGKPFASETALPCPFLCLSPCLHSLGLMLSFPSGGGLCTCGLYTRTYAHTCTHSRAHAQSCTHSWVQLWAGVDCTDLAKLAAEAS